MFAKFNELDNRFEFSISDNEGHDIADEYHTELMSAHSNGKVISADENGYPIIIDRPSEPIAPSSCSPWQIRKALNNENLRDTVENVVAASSDISIKDGWEFATEFRSNDPFVLQIGVLIGKDEDQTRIFIQQASTL